MKTLITLSLMLVFSISAKSQTSKIYSEVEKPAEFVGGNEALVKYIQTNLIYPESAKKDKLSGKSFVRFVITEAGKIERAEVVKGAENCKACDEEALRVVKQMPDWKAAEVKGKSVNSQYTLPIQFKL